MADGPAGDLLARIADFVLRTPAARDETDADDRRRFEALALEAFAYQYRSVAPFARLCRERGATPGTVPSWRRVPAVPTSAFASLALHAAPPREVFRSSGTTGGGRSVHHHPFPDLYRAVIDASFPAFCLPPSLSRTAGDGPPMLSLIPDRRQLEDSSLGFMVDHVVRCFGGEGSAYAFGPAGVETETADAWCRARIAEGRPALVLATAFALVQWLDALRDAGRRLALPAGSAVFETGGFKGRTRELERATLVARIGRRLGVPAARIVREYGMTELTSQLYSRALLGGDPELLVAPPWVRARVLDAATLEEAPPGALGLIAIFDLANVGSALHVLTEDLGVAVPAEDDRQAGIQLIGRAEASALRGCSLVVEELSGGARR